MPYIKISSAKKLSAEEEAALVSGIGAAVNRTLGHNPDHVDVEISQGKTIYRGSVRQEDFAYLDVRYLRCQKFQTKKALAVELFGAVKNAIGTPENKMCLSMSEFHSWGGFGDFIDEFYEE